MRKKTNRNVFSFLLSMELDFNIFQIIHFRSEHTDERKVLHPDNPLLEKFQKALKEHLERQINHLKDDIFEYVILNFNY